MSNDVATVERGPGGHFVKGQSGNPAGRPKNRHIKELQQDLEIAVRENLDVARVHRIVNKMADMAEAGNVKAAKLLLDKIISNASNSDDNAGGDGRTVVFRIENATFAAQQPKLEGHEDRVIDVIAVPVGTDTTGDKDGK